MVSEKDGLGLKLKTTDLHSFHNKPIRIHFVKYLKIIIANIFLEVARSVCFMLYPLLIRIWGGLLELFHKIHKNKTNPVVLV